MQDWMQALATHYEETRRRYPGERLLVMFDIDGTILDMRHMVRHLLVAYDRAHGTSYFRTLRLEEIRVHENQVDRLLEERGLKEEVREKVLRFYIALRWSPEAVLASHRPFRGVMEVIRWFQIQPDTHVGLNTGRPESLREETLESLNALGREYRVRFHTELLHMNAEGTHAAVIPARLEGLRRFREEGYRVFAAVDNEPANIRAMAEEDPDGEILFLHADTLFESQRKETPRTVRGSSYDFANLMLEAELPRHVQLVWHGIDSHPSMRRFLQSEVQWAECDVRRDPIGRIVLRRRPFEEAPWEEGEDLVTLEECLAAFRNRGKSIKLDLHEGGELVGQVCSLLSHARWEDERLWFNGSLETVNELGFRALSTYFPRATVQCPVGFLAPLIATSPGRAKELLAMFASWGVNRFSIGWQAPGQRRVFQFVDGLGYETNIYDVPDLEDFLQAVLLLPRSLTSRFVASRTPTATATPAAG
jgi:phosphoglycolate phosphatase-like HAD superfamily hydrolase